MSPFDFLLVCTEWFLVCVASSWTALLLVGGSSSSLSSSSSSSLNGSGATLRSLRLTLLTLGVGLLIGSAIGVTLPKGIHTLYSTPHDASFMTPRSTSMHPAPTPNGQHPPDGLPDPNDRSWEADLARFKRMPKHKRDQGQEHDHDHDHDASSPPTAPLTGHAQQDEHSPIDNHSPNSGASTTSQPRPRRQLLHAGTLEEFGHSLISAQIEPAAATIKSLTPAAPTKNVVAEAAATHNPLTPKDAHDHVGETGDDHSFQQSSSIFCFDESHGSRLMGAAMAIGFVCMLLIERCTDRSPSLPSIAGNMSDKHDDIEMVNTNQFVNRFSPNLDQLKSRSSSANSSSNNGGNGGKGASDSVSTSGSSGSNLAGSSSSSSTKSSSNSLSSPTVRSTVKVHVQSSHSQTAGLASSSSSPSPMPAGSMLSSQSSSSSGSHTSSIVHLQVPSPALSSSSASSSSVSPASPWHALQSSQSLALPLMASLLFHVCIEGMIAGSLVISSDSLSPDLLWSTCMVRSPFMFGVACFMCLQSSPISTIRRQLLLLATAGPLVALLTCVMLNGVDVHAFGDGSGRGLIRLAGAGAMFFSIALYIMPTLQEKHAAATDAINGSMTARDSYAHGHAHSSASNSPMPAHSHHRNTDDSSSSSSSSLRSPSPDVHGTDSHASSMPWRDVIALCIGLILPLMLNDMRTSPLLD